MQGHTDDELSGDKEKKVMGSADKQRRYVLTQEQLDNIVEIATREGVRAFRSEQKKEDKKRARNTDKIAKTKKMLSSYRRIKVTLSEEAEFTEEEKIELRWRFIEDLMGNAQDIAKRSEMTIQDTEKRRQEDLYCIDRIEKAAEMYRNECEKSKNEEAKRRYRELEMMYLGEEEMTVEEIAERENVSDKTVYRDLGMACSIVAVYMLGV